MDLKINNFKDNKPTATKTICPIFLQYQTDVHVSTKIKTFIFYKWGQVEAKEILKKSNKMEAFP